MVHKAFHGFFSCWCLKFAVAFTGGFFPHGLIEMNLRAKKTLTFSCTPVGSHLQNAFPALVISAASSAFYLPSCRYSTGSIYLTTFFDGNNFAELWMTFPRNLHASRSKCLFPFQSHLRLPVWRWTSPLADLHLQFVWNRWALVLWLSLAPCNRQKSPVAVKLLLNRKIEWNLPSVKGF